MKLKPSEVQDDIVRLLNVGLNSKEVTDELKKKYGKDSFTKGIERSVRRIREGLKLNKDQVLSEKVRTLMAEKGVDSESSNWSTAWYKPDKHLSVLLKNPKNGLENNLDLNTVREEFVKEISKFSPNFEKIIYNKSSGGHCLVIDIADLHIGKLATETGTGEEYSVETAISRAREGVKGILQKTAGFKIDQFVFVVGNDVLHTDNTTRSTTSGTPQDTDGMWYDNFKVARALYVSIIEGLTHTAPVHVIHCPSNHDFMSGFMLADSIHGWLYRNENVTFDITIKYRKFYRYGKSLMMFEHGDGTPMDKLPIIMAEESKLDWAETEFRYIYLHHIHSNKKVKFLVSADSPGVNIQYLRSPSSTDMWHHKKGWQHSKKAIEGFIHSKSFGQCSAVTHYFI